MKNMDYKWKPSRGTTKSMLLLLAKMNGAQRRILEECIVHTEVCQKVPLRLKQHQTAKESSP